jgi:hypothetical protein
MSDTLVKPLTRREVAHLAREFAVEQQFSDGYGSRGRVSKNVVFQFVLAKSAKDVRKIAADLGVEVAPTGKISEAEYLAISDVVAGNAPKETTEGE